MAANVEQLAQVLSDARKEIGKVIIGQKAVVDMSLIAVFTGSHALVEGVPGVAKTLLVRTLAKVLGSPFARIQFTPDLMPSDITGINVFNLQRNEFTLVKGPVFTTFLLADEINRAPSKTQSALLQAMQERRVTIDGETHSLSPHFTVFATQNPIEYEGTYPLPEAQKDRFMFKVSMDYPEKEEELKLAQETLGNAPPEALLDQGAPATVLTGDKIQEFRKVLQQVTVREELGGYVVDIVRATRRNESLLVGGGPRATLSLLLAARAHAVLEGRDFMTPDDVKAMAPPVLEHRLVMRPEFEIEELTVKEVLQRILQEIAVPR